MGLKASLGYILTSRLAWATREPVLEEEDKYEEEEGEDATESSWAG